MEEKNYTIATADTLLPAPYDSDPQEDEPDISVETANNYLLMMRNVIDERIEQRIRDGQDIAKVYTAEITSSTTHDITIGSVMIDDKSLGITAPVLTSITVRYNEDDHTDIANDSVKVLSPGDRWVRICTYDGVNFYVLHKI